MTRFRTVLLLLAVAAPLSAQTSTTPKNPTSVPSGDADNGIHAATLLMRGVTPRGVALGEAMGAVEGDPSTFFYPTASEVVALARASARLDQIPVVVGGSSITMTADDITIVAPRIFLNP